MAAGDALGVLLRLYDYSGGLWEMGRTTIHLFSVLAVEREEVRVFWNRLLVFLLPCFVLWIAMELRLDRSSQ